MSNPIYIINTKTGHWGKCRSGAHAIKASRLSRASIDRLIHNDELTTVRDQRAVAEGVTPVKPRGLSLLQHIKHIMSELAHVAASPSNHHNVYVFPTEAKATSYAKALWPDLIKRAKQSLCYAIHLTDQGVDALTVANEVREAEILLRTAAKFEVEGEFKALALYEALCTESYMCYHVRRYFQASVNPAIDQRVQLVRALEYIEQEETTPISYDTL